MAMRAVRTHLAFRIVWLVFGVTIGIIQLANGGAAKSFGLCLSGVGMMLLGGLWFLIPAIPTIPLRNALQASHSAALGWGNFVPRWPAARSRAWHAAKFCTSDSKSDSREMTPGCQRYAPILRNPLH